LFYSFRNCSLQFLQWSGILTPFHLLAYDSSFPQWLLSFMQTSIFYQQHTLNQRNLSFYNSLCFPSMHLSPTHFVEMCPSCSSVPSSTLPQSLTFIQFAPLLLLPAVYLILLLFISYNT
jgi:hypothetical protein